jgi:hypothetical protein
VVTAVFGLLKLAVVPSKKYHLLTVLASNVPPNPKPLAVVVPENG